MSGVFLNKGHIVRLKRISLSMERIKSGIVIKSIANVPRRYSMVMFLLFSFIAGALAQTAGDYRSSGNGDFDQAGTWETYNGSAWVPASAPPDENDGTVTIQSIHTVTITADATINNLDVYGTLNVEIETVLTVLGDIHVYPSGTMNVDDKPTWPLFPIIDPAAIAVYGNFINEGTVDFQDALVVVAGNFDSTGSTSMNNPGLLDIGNIVVGGNVTGNFDFGGDAEGQLSAVNPGATVDLTPPDSYGTSIPGWVGLVFPDIAALLNTVIYGSPSPCPYDIEGPLNTISCSGATVFFEITSTSAISPTYQWEVNDGSGWTNVANGGVYSGANTSILAISTAGISMDGYIFRCELEDASACVRKSYTATLTISNDAAPSAPATTGASGCINTSLTLTASGAGAGEDYLWYDAAAGGTVLQFSGSSYTTPTLTSTTTYYVSVYNTTSSCESERTSATATVVVINTAGAGSSTPTLCVNTALTDITHATTGATGIGAATGLPAGVTASWALDEITITGTPTADGVFDYIIPLTGGCGTVNATGTITVIPDNTTVPPDNASSNPADVCAGDGVITLSYAGGDPGSNGIAVWYDDDQFTSMVGTGNGLTVAAPAVTTTYYVRFEADCDISEAVSVVVNVWPLPVPVFTEMTENTCTNGPLIRYVAGGLAGSTFSWNITNGTIVQNNNDTIYVDWGDQVLTGTIELTEISANGCTSLPVSLQVEVGGPELDLGENVGVCSGSSISIEAEGDYDAYLWQDGSTGPVYTTDQEEWVILEVWDAVGCSTKDSLYVSVYPVPEVDLGPDTTVCDNEELVLDAGTDGTIYRWSTGEVSQRITVYNDGDQEIWVELENEQGCVGGDTVLIEACDVYYDFDPPTAFTPNGDGVNDVWNLYGLLEFPESVVEIYDQWGTLTWKSEPGYSQAWDGNNMNGRPVPFDSYHFVVYFNDGSNERYMGIVTVIK